MRGYYTPKMKEIKEVMVPPLVHLSQTAPMYDKWNNIPHYTQTEKYGRGPCEPSLNSYYAHH